MDRKWWQHYIGKVDAAFDGERLTVADLPSRYRARRMTAKHFGNSGTMAIAIAINRGAARVVLLGYDCQKTGGKVHWHGDHQHQLGNAGSMPTWATKFAALQKTLGGKAQIINATRSTALRCFERQTLEQALGPD